MLNSGQNMFTQLFESPVGALLITADEAAITRLDWAKNLPLGFVETPNTITNLAANDLKNYFNKTKKHFDSKFNLSGTDFQNKVWAMLATIPHGETWTYQQLAEKVNSAPRAVGGAVGANPIPILLPCHRVVGANGQLVGYSGDGGIETKKILLALES